MSEDSEGIYSSSLGFTSVIYTGISPCPFGNRWRDEGVEVRTSKLMSFLFSALKEDVREVAFTGVRMRQSEHKNGCARSSQNPPSPLACLVVTRKKYFKTNTKLSSLQGTFPGCSMVQFYFQAELNVDLFEA